MSTWISENKSIAVILGVGAVAFLGIAGFGTKQLLAQMNDDQEYQSLNQSIQDQTQSSIPPTKESLEQRKASLEEYKALAGQAKEFYGRFIPTKDQLANVAPDQFRTKLQTVTNDFKAKATEKKVKLPEGFLMGFESYATTPPLQPATGVMLYELSAIDWLMNVALESDTTEIIRIFRTRTPLEDPVAATDKAKNAKDAKAKIEFLPMSLTLKGKRESVRKMINQIVTNEKYLFLVRAMQSKNDKVAAVTLNTPAPAKKDEAKKSNDGALDFDGASKDAKKEEEAAKTVPQAQEILKPVVGNELVECHIVLDLVMIPSTQEEAKPAAKATEEESE